MDLWVLLALPAGKRYLQLRFLGSKYTKNAFVAEILRDNY